VAKPKYSGDSTKCTSPARTMSAVPCPLDALRYPQHTRHQDPSIAYQQLKPSPLFEWKWIGRRELAFTAIDDKPSRRMGILGRERRQQETCRREQDVVPHSLQVSLLPTLRVCQSLKKQAKERNQGVEKNDAAWGRPATSREGIGCTWQSIRYIDHSWPVAHDGKPTGVACEEAA
jgi:hypothetical protein